MADDVDDLINDLEISHGSGRKHNQQSNSNENKKRITTKQNDEVNLTHSVTNTKRSNFDDLLSEIETVDDSSSRESDVEPVRTGSIRKQTDTRCYPLLATGTTINRGLCTSVNARACDHLRCTSCDFAVCSYDNYQWHSSTDYLFLRNNMPVLEKLKSKLVKKAGCRAYACQCQWSSVTERTDLLQRPDLKWVCGGH